MCRCASLVAMRRISLIDQRMKGGWVLLESPARLAIFFGGEPRRVCWGITRDKDGIMLPVAQNRITAPRLIVSAWIL